MKRKRWTEDEKVAIVLEVIRGETPVEEIARSRTFDHLSEDDVARIVHECRREASTSQ